MKLWKKTVALMLCTLLVSLVLVGGLTLFITGKRSIENTAQTYGKQMQSCVRLLEQFWDNGKYSRMTVVGKHSYENFQLRQCCGPGYALVDQAGNVLENLTDYSIVDANALDVVSVENFDYRLQHLPGKVLLLQKTGLVRPEGFFLVSVHEITEVFVEVQRLALWFLGIYSGIFLLAGLFIWGMMRKTVQTMEALQEVADKQELMLGALAHEMKTPLTSIIGYSDSLLHVKLKEEQKERALMHINREGRRMEALSGKMLQMLGLYKNNAVHMEACSALALLKQVEEVEREKAAQNGIHIVTEGEDFTVRVDFALMESLLLNLVDNAVRASREGSTVILRARESGREKLFQVCDQGRGIPLNEIPKVTEAFYMVDKARSRKEGGAGLGLYLCRRIVKLHQGRLEIESREGEGTTVTVRL